MSTDQDKLLREELSLALRGNRSHIDFTSAVSDFPKELAGTKPKDAPHTAWQLIEHLRIAQNDILEFSRNPNHKSPSWPEGYWPKSEAPGSTQEWEQSVAHFEEDLRQMAELIMDPRNDLFKAIDGGSGQTLLREAIVLGNHNSYHLGQLVYLKRQLLDEGGH